MYAYVYLIHLNTLEGNLHLYRLEHDKVALWVRIKVPQGPGDIRVVDNLIVVWNYYEQESHLFDIDSKLYRQKPFVVL